MPKFDVTASVTTELDIHVTVEAENETAAKALIDGKTAEEIELVGTVDHDRLSEALTNWELFEGDVMRVFDVERLDDEVDV